MTTEQIHDVAIVGAGAAGLSAAVALARSRRSVIVVEVVRGAVRELRAEGGVLRAVVLDDGHAFPVDAVAVAPRFAARAELYEQLGGTLTDDPKGTFITADPTGRTAVPGVWAAGNVSDLAAMVSVAAGAGVMAGAALNAALVAEDATTAVRTRTLTSAHR